MTIWQDIKWWSRWWVRYFPVLAVRRLTCSHAVRYDGGGNCLDCGAPWFRDVT